MRTSRSALAARARLAPVLSVLALALAACRDGDTVQRLDEPPLPREVDRLDAEIAESIRAVAQRVRAGADDVLAWAELGMVYEANHLPALAGICYGQAIARAPDEPKWWFRSAMSEAATGHFDEAIDDMERAIELRDDYAPAHWRLGEWRLAQADVEGARRSFAAAREHDPRHPGGWVGAGRVHLERGETDEAIAAFERARALVPRDGYVHHLLGLAYRRAGRIDEARAAAAKSSAGDPLWPDPWEDEVWRRAVLEPLSHAKQMVRIGRPDRAIELLEVLRVERPDDVALLRTLAGAYQATSRLDDALEVLQHSLSVEPDHARTHMNLVVLYEQRGEAGAALAHLDRVLALQPDWSVAHYEKGSLLLRLDRAPQALRSFREALRCDARDHGLRLRVGELELSLSDWSAAARTFAEALRYDPDDAGARVGLAVAQVRLGRLDEGEQSLLRAAELEGVDRARIDAARELLAERRTAEGARDGD